MSLQCSAALHGSDVIVPHLSCRNRASGGSRKAADEAHSSLDRNR